MGKTRGMNMLVLKTNMNIDFDLATLPPSSLNDLYDRTLEELKQLSQITPGDVLDTNEMDQREDDLLEFESSVLNHAAQVPLKNSKDVQSLIDFWAKSSGVNDGVKLSPTDRIVMNIFRHLSGKLGD